jgi:hypothetical protein
MLSWRRPGLEEQQDGAVSWQLRGIAAISPSRAADAPMFRCTSAPFRRLNRRWNLIAQIDRSADAVGFFLRETSADPQQQPPPQQQGERYTVSFLLELVAKGAGGEIVLAQHRSDSCQFTTAPPDASPTTAAAAAWGNLRMATLQQVRSTALWCTIYARVVIANDPAGLNDALFAEESARLATPPRQAGGSPFSTPPASVHLSLHGGSTPGSGASAEGSPTAAAAAPRRLDLSPDLPDTRGPSLEPEFPALLTTPAAHHAAAQWAPPAEAEPHEPHEPHEPQPEVEQSQGSGGLESAAAAAEEDCEAVAAIEAAAAMRARLAAMIGDMDET